MTQESARKLVDAAKERIALIDEDEPTTGAVATKRRPPVVLEEGDPRSTPDWTKSCDNCGEKPILSLTGMCGPCTFGEAATAGGNW